MSQATRTRKSMGGEFKHTTTSKSKPCRYCNRPVSVPHGEYCPMKKGGN